MVICLFYLSSTKKIMVIYIFLWYYNIEVNDMKNNKGMILSTYVYMLLVFFLLLLGTMLVVLNNTKLLADKLKENAKDNPALY